MSKIVTPDEFAAAAATPSNRGSNRTKSNDYAYEVLVKRRRAVDVARELGVSAQTVQRAARKLLAIIEHNREQINKGKNIL